MSIIQFTNKGIFCEQGNFYIDPSGRVDYAIVTHAHTDHATSGSTKYLSHKLTKPLIESRIRAKNVQGIEFGETININGVNATLYPSGHIIGSAQVKLEYKGETAVITGDFKNVNDNVSGQYEPIETNTLVIESTFGVPDYQWEPQEDVYSEINEWWKTNQILKKNSVIFCYSLGKAQRVLKNVDHTIGPIIVHDSIEHINKIIIDNGVDLPKTLKFDELSSPKFNNALILAPSHSMRTGWLYNFRPFSIGEASGWMQTGRFRSRHIEKGFALSDHADFPGLNYAVRESNPDKIFVVHGYTKEFSSHLRNLGYDAVEAYPKTSKKNTGQLSLNFDVT
jgi:putative mRNA 3-end processing factor